MAVPVMESTPVLVMEGEAEPTTVKEEQETPEEQEADEVATSCSNPLAPKYARLGVVRLVKKVLLLKVEEAVEKRPPKKPMTVEVEL